MKISRRQFNLFAGLNLLALPSIAKAKEPDNGVQKYKGFYILQGASDDKSCFFSVLAPKSETLNFEIQELNSKSFLSPAEVDYEDRTYSHWRIYTLYCDRLSLNSNYHLIIKDHRGTTRDLREFSAFDHQNPQLRFAIASCMNDSKHNKKIWKKFSETQPDFAFFVGDMVYGDYPSDRNEIKYADEKQLWERYVESFQELDVYRFKKLIPIFSTWDDHDTGANDCNRSFALLPYGQKLFRRFFPGDERGALIEKGPGVAQVIRTQNQDFFMLDGRSFRSEKKAADETIMGTAQEQWLLSKLNKNKVSWLMMGTQWSTPYKQAETYINSHPNSHKQIMKKLKNSGAKIVFCSGDVHFSEVTKVKNDQLGYDTLEFTSSAMHSFHFPGMERFLNNPQRIASITANCFLMFECNNEPHSLKGKVSCLSTRSKPVFKVDFDLFK